MRTLKASKHVKATMKKDPIERIRNEVQGIAYIIREDCDRLYSRSWAKIDRLLGEIEKELNELRKIY